MIPSSFNESNCVLDKPKDMNYEECSCLSVYQGTYDDGIPVVISCWKPTESELKEINKTGRVWLAIIGHSMPPAWVNGHNPFK